MLEINPTHPLIHKLSDTLKTEGDKKKELLTDATMLLFEQAGVAEGETVKDPQAFMERMTKFMLGSF